MVKSRTCEWCRRDTVSSTVYTVRIKGRGNTQTIPKGCDRCGPYVDEYLAEFYEWEEVTRADIKEFETWMRYNHPFIAKRWWGKKGLVF